MLIITVLYFIFLGIDACIDKLIVPYLTVLLPAQPISMKFWINTTSLWSVELSKYQDSKTNIYADRLKRAWI